MNRAVIAGTGLLLTAVVIGCGGPAEDQTMKEMINLTNQMADLMEKGAKDEATMKELKRIDARGKELKKTVDSWPEAKRVEMEKKYDSEMKAAATRVLKAMGAGGIPGFPK